MTTLQQARRRLDRLEEAQTATTQLDEREQRIAEYNQRFADAVISMLQSMPRDSAEMVWAEIQRQVDEQGYWDPPRHDVLDLPHNLPSGASTRLCQTVSHWAHMAASRRFPPEPVIPEALCRFIEQQDPNDQLWWNDYQCIDCGQLVLGYKAPEEPRSDPFQNCPVCGGPTLHPQYRKAILDAVAQESDAAANALKEEIRERRRKDWPVTWGFQANYPHPASTEYQRVIGAAMAQYEGWAGHC